MQIILNDELVIKKRNQIIFESRPVEITSVILLAGQKLYLPTILANIFKLPTTLVHIILVTEKTEITVAHYDQGFKDLVQWLSSFGWRMDSGVQRAYEAPLIRTVVEKGKEVSSAR